MSIVIVLEIIQKSNLATGFLASETQQRTGVAGRVGFPYHPLNDNTWQTWMLGFQDV